MAKPLPRAYPPEFRHKAVELVRSGRSVAAVSRQLDVSRQTIMNWLKQNDADSGRRDDLLNSDKRKEHILKRQSNPLVERSKERSRGDTIKGLS